MSAFPAGMTKIIVYVPKTLKRRAKDAAELRVCSLSDVVREGLILRVDQILNATPIESNRVDDKRSVERVHAATPFGDRPAPQVIIQPPQDRIEILFSRHANRLIASLSDPATRDKRQAEALAEIKRMAPLRYGDENKIVAKLEEIIAERLTRMAAQDEAAMARATGEPIEEPPTPPPPTRTETLQHMMELLRSGSPPSAHDDLTGTALKTPIKTRPLISSKPNPEEE